MNDSATIERRRGGPFAAAEGELGIGALAAVFSGVLAEKVSTASPAHRIVLVKGKKPHIISPGEWHSNTTRKEVVAYLDPRRFTEAQVRKLADRWATPIPEGRRMQEMLDDLDAVPSRALDGRIRAALPLLRAHVAPSRVSREVGMAERSLNRLFLDRLGAPPKRWMGWMRLREGLDHLFDGYNVTEAAHLSGFADASHFSRACKAALGVSPNGLRRLAIYRSVSTGGCTV